MAAAQSGTLDRSGGVALFMHLRDEAPMKSMLRDVGHSIAHDERTKGESFEYVARHVKTLRRVFALGGVLSIKIMFPIHELLDELAEQVEEHGIAVDRPALHEQWRMLADLVADILDGVEYRLSGAVATLEAGPQHALVVQFDKPLVGGAITVPEGVALAFPLLYDLPRE